MNEFIVTFYVFHLEFLECVRVLNCEFIRILYKAPFENFMITATKTPRWWHLCYVETFCRTVNVWRTHLAQIKLVVHSCQQKSIGLKFSKFRTGSDVWYSCHHNSSRFTFPIFSHSCRFSIFHSLQSITPRIY